MQVSVNAEMQMLIAWNSGRTWQRAVPKYQFLTMELAGVIVPEIKHTAVSEHDKLTMNKFRTD